MSKSVAKGKLEPIQRSDKKQLKVTENKVNKSDESIKEINEDKERKASKERRKLRKTIRDESKRIIQLVVPISICMLIVVLSITWFPAYGSGVESTVAEHLPFYERKESSTGSKIGSAVIVMVIFLILIAVITFCMAVIIIYEFDRVIKYFFYFAFSLYFILFDMIYITIAVIEYNITIDWITVLFIIYNHSGVGLITFFYAGPKLLKQILLVWLSANLALLLILILPNWSAWLIMIVIAGWDCYAVLHKSGPLNRIMDKMEENRGKGKEAPPLLYATAVWLSTDSNGSDTGIEMGLGDFVFYSLLVGKSFVSGDLLVAIICYISILVGVAITLFILVQSETALPALPFSIALGIIANFITTYTIVPFNDALQEKLIFI